MDEELDKELCKKYPNLYRDRSLPPTQSCMYFGFPGTGWYELLNELSAKLEAEILKLPEAERINYRASQVKEKFGTLRFYMSKETPEMSDAIRNAEDISTRTCEECGQSGELDNSKTWLATNCETCRYKRNR